MQELFGLLPEALAKQEDRPWPITLGELATQVALPLADVKRILAEVRHEAVGIEIDQAAFRQITRAAGTLVVDIRLHSEYEQGHLPEAIWLQGSDFGALLPRLLAASQVVCVCQHGVRSVSAAMYLRRLGVKTAVSLRGGMAALGD